MLTLCADVVVMLCAGMGSRGLRADGEPERSFPAKLEASRCPPRGAGCRVHLRRPGGKTSFECKLTKLGYRLLNPSGTVSGFLGAKYLEVM